MRRTAVLLLLSALFVGLGLVTASPAAACSCAGGTTAQYFDGADAVFTGRLISREVGGLGPISSSGASALHVFAVDTVVKGDVHARQGVVSAASGASCGLELSGDGPFVVFANRSPDVADDRFEANLCGGTGPLTPALAAELENLVGPGSSPLAPVSPDTETVFPDMETARTDQRWPVVILLGTAVAIVVAALVLWRRSRRVLPDPEG